MALKLDAIGKKIGPILKEYTWQDVVLYALGVGAGFDDLDFAYEKNLKVIPSFSIAAVFDFLARAGTSTNANLAGILHGEQDLIFHNPIPTEGTLSTTGAVTHIYDKGEKKGAVIIAEGDTFHSNGKKLFTNVLTIFSRLDGGFGGDPGPSEELAFPDRDPDFVEDAEPQRNQPLIYRLSGDVFALHADPEFAKMSGFEMPIMHGLCTHGFACRAVIKHLMPGEPERMTRFKCRFSKTLYPGIPIRTLIWKESEERALWRVVNAENGDVVIDRGIVEWISSAAAKERAAREAIRFDDRVAIVTGAGGGLGRVYALDLAKRGAKVVVNDLGGAPDGSGDGSASPADQVVEEIRALGGEAVASYDSVATPEGGRAIVDKALEAFGRVDVLINNAGILRDKSLAKLEPSDWDAVLSVHLNGAYNVTRPAFAYMKEHGYGRIVMTTSAAGLFGNFGQTNYSAAKLGLVGLMNTLELEGARYDVKVNTVAPIAATRLTEDLLPPNVLEKLKPEYVSPLVLYLAAEQCPVSGTIYNAGAGYFNRAAVVAGQGAAFPDGLTVEDLAKRWKQVTSLAGASEFPDAMAALGPMMEALEGPPAEGDEEGGTSCAAVFDQMADHFLPEKAEGVDVVFQWKLSGEGGGEWHAIIKDQTCEVNAGVHDNPTCTILMDAADFIAFLEGKLNAMSAFSSGKLKIEGDMMKSQLVEKLFKL